MINKHILIIDGSKSSSRQHLHFTNYSPDDLVDDFGGGRGGVGHVLINDHHSRIIMLE